MTIAPETADRPLPARVDVAIAGLGPTGVTLAGLLARQGLSVLAVDRAADVHPQPRAVGFDHDAMRIFQTLGVADALAPHVTPFREGIYVGADGQTIRRIHHVAPPYPLTWAPHFSCDQPGMEAVLRDALAREPRARVATATELQTHEERTGSVRLDLRQADGEPATCEARYLIGCDGASSPIRRRLGIALDDLQYDEPWIVVDVLVNADVLPRLPPVNIQYCDPVRPSTYINCPGRHRRWEFMRLPGEPSEGDLDPTRLWSLLARWLAPGEATIWRAAAYRFHALVARRWRHGRVLLAGDSAHQTPPFLGQGMCQGLRDAGNLAWKLGAVLRGDADDTLLDSYEAERKPHVIETTRLAKTFGEIISERDPAAARVRDARILAAHGGQPQTLVRQDLIPPLAHGLIAADAPLAGRTFPQPRVDTATHAGVMLDDVCGPRWRVVLLEADDTGEADGTGEADDTGEAGDTDNADDARDSGVDDTLATLAANARAADLDVVLLTDSVAHAADGMHRVREHHGLLAAWLDAARCRGVIVRPDHAVYAGFTDLGQAGRQLATLSRLAWPGRSGPGAPRVASEPTRCSASDATARVT